MGSNDFRHQYGFADLASRLKATVIGQGKRLVPPIVFYFAGAKSKTLSRSLSSPRHWSTSRL